MNFKLPVIVSDLTGCASDLVNENTGCVFQTGNINELVGSIRSVVGYKTESQVLIKSYSYNQIVNNLKIFLHYISE
jgi:hypothetical protein